MGGVMARGDHPMRTPVYGAALIVAAMLGSIVVWQSHWPSWLKGALLAAALVMALAGWLMTFRDLSRPRSRSPRCWSRSARR
jgi:UDP-N-acetylmuramyl pentapeptide phosphotransferase/UDP-N-acetylglucosamine-1-phosphate transferase